MARTKAQLSAGVRLANCLTVGYLAMRCPVGKVRDTLALHDAQSQRQRGLPQPGRGTEYSVIFAVAQFNGVFLHWLHSWRWSPHGVGHSGVSGP
jgi:hypothetical protein